MFTGLGCAEYTIQLDESLHSYPLKQKLKTLENMSVISCVEGATDRVNNLVIVEKMVKNWSLRLCLDPPDLNHAIKSEFNHPSSPEQI